ncbi:MAG: response regulator [Candidatus Lernaella stagnicola]|nr:response regulator [Candidatus Lernaella stagnicola]
MITEEQIKKARILIVDDNPVNVTLLTRILEAYGFANCRGESDSKRVLDVYREFRPDLVLLDLMMPDVDGFDILAKLPELEPDAYVSVLVITALTDRDVRLRALAGGAKDFITKPFDDTETINRIRNLLEVRLAHKIVRDQNEMLETMVRDRTRELNESRLEIIRRLSQAAEYKDNQTGMHIVRMSKMAYRLGCVVGLDQRHCELILSASPMHDVGKIGIPDHILLKPGILDAHEWEIMKTHTTKGFELLRENENELFIVARNIALYHHERWDGLGYPAGLEGEDIPIAGRICAICDVFDALISERPYKAPWPVRSAYDAIVAGGGSQFDPFLVERFAASFGELLDLEDYHGTGQNPRLH